MKQPQKSIDLHKAVAIALQAKLEGARWESAVEDYVTKECGRDLDMARATVGIVRHNVNK